MPKDRSQPKLSSNWDPSCIAIKLTGGTGNQLFGFFTAYAIAKSHGYRVIVDLSNYSHFNLRAFSLNQFLNNEFKLGSSSGYLHVQENSFNFSEEILSTQGGCVLNGYFQSYKYFQIYRNEIIEFFERSVPLQPSSINQERLVLHLRRGDYTKKRNVKFHGLCSFDYYIESVTHLRQVLGFLPVEIFSDDIDCAEQLRKQIENSFVTPKGTSFTDLEIIRYMSTGKGYILSNSTFGWWASWLNPKNDIPTVSPDPWFTNKKINTLDLIPKHWIKLSR